MGYKPLCLLHGDGPRDQRDCVRPRLAEGRMGMLALPALRTPVRASHDALVMSPSSCKAGCIPRKALAQGPTRSGALAEAKQRAAEFLAVLSPPAPGTSVCCGTWKPSPGAGSNSCFSRWWGTCHTASSSPSPVQGLSPALLASVPPLTLAWYSPLLADRGHGAIWQGQSWSSQWGLRGGGLAWQVPVLQPN